VGGKHVIRGIYAPISTPFEQGQVSFPRLRGNLERWAATRLAGLVVLGSNGEAVLLDQVEKESLIGYVREHFPKDRPVIAGTGCESTRETIAFSRRAAGLGADAVLVITPSFYKGSMTSSALRRFYTEVAEACPVPVMLYNMPRNTGLNLPARVVVELAAHPNIVGIKDSGGDIVQIAEIIAGAPPGFVVFAGSGSFLLATLVLGGQGGTLALANVAADACAQLQEKFEGGDLAAARRLQLALIPLNQAVTSRYGVGGLKAALDLIGYFGGEVRPPLEPVGEAERREISKLLRDLGLLPA